MLLLQVHSNNNTAPRSIVAQKPSWAPPIETAALDVGAAIAGVEFEVVAEFEVEVVDGAAAVVVVAPDALSEAYAAAVLLAAAAAVVAVDKPSPPLLLPLSLKLELPPAAPPLLLLLALAALEP